ncbi:MAG: ligand-binding sensor domain-containing protein [Phenylobacterium sp.]|jgi:ligand-binding sensor domain-containing protein
MIIHIRFFFIALFFVFLSPSTLATSHSLHFQHISLEEGLPNLTILCQLQDRKGFMWFGTRRGLVRYDGYEFRLYQSNIDDPFAISFNYINALYQDYEGFIWVGTDGGGLNRFDPQTEQFKHYLHQDRSIDNNDIRNLSHDTVYAIEPAGEGKIWIGTADGLNLFDPHSDRFSVYRHQSGNEKSLAANDVRALLVTPDGGLWIGLDDGGLNWRDPDSGDFHRYTISDETAVKLSALDFDRDNHGQNNLNKLWIGSSNAGLFSIDLQQGAPGNVGEGAGAGEGEVKALHYQHEPGDETSLSDNDVHTVFNDSYGRVWVGTSNGLNLFDQRAAHFKVLYSKPGDVQGLSDNRIQSISEDSTGMLWFGSWHGGLNVLDPRTIAFDTLASDPLEPGSLSDNIINAIHLDLSGDLWVGGNKGLNFRAKNGDHFTRFVHDPSKPGSLTDNVVRTILVDGESMIWVGTKQGGLDRWSKENQQFTHYTYDPDDSHSLIDNAVQHIYQRRNGQVWIATRGGLNRWDPIHQHFDTFIHHPDDKKSLSNDYLYQLYEDSQQRLWIATRYGGLNLWLDESQSFQSFEHSIDDDTSLNSNFVTSIYEDPQGIIWVGTVGGGLNKGTVISDKNQPLQLSFEHFTSKQGLQSDLIAAIVADDRGSLWISTTGGISRFDPQRKQFVNFGGVEGAQPGGYLIGSFGQDSQGRIYFGGIKGVTHFLPSQVKAEFKPPRLALTALRLQNRPVNILPGQQDAVLPRAIQYIEGITLSHQQSVFSLEFSALHYGRSLSNQYAYQLLGFDRQWVNTDAKRRYASYTNLPAGQYTFRVKAASKDGVWDEQGISLNITILPPWWLTWWAKTLASILVMSALYGVYRLRINLLTEQRKALEIEVEQRTHTLAVLSDIGKEISSSLNLDLILDTLYRRVNKLMDATVFGIGIYHPDKQIIDYQLAIENNHRYPPYSRDMRDKSQFAVWCIDHKKPVFINDVTVEYAQFIDEVSDHTREKLLLANGRSPQAPHSLIYIPLMIKDRVLGVIKVQSHQTNAYDSHHMDMLQTLATYTATAIDNANAFHQIEVQNSEILAAQQQLILAEKMASLGTMTAGVAH